MPLGPDTVNPFILTVAPLLMSTTYGSKFVFVLGSVSGALIMVTLAPVLLV